MEITLHNTEKIVEVNGAPARIWEGKTAGGVEVIAFIARIGLAEGQAEEAYADFERELQEVHPPSPAARSFDSRA